MTLKKLALIVDGPTEEGSLRAQMQMKYYDSPCFRNGPGNGITYTTEGYAKGVLPTLIYLLSSDVRAIILIPDLENRKETSIHFSEKMKSEIVEHLMSETKFCEEYLNGIIHVCPSNRMFENWIISDIEGIKKIPELIRLEAIQKDFEGKHGASELQKVMTIKYKKTVHAQKLFKKTNEEISIANSASFKAFIEIFHELVSIHCQ